MRFKPRYNEYEVRVLQILVSRERLSEIIGEMYQTGLEHMLWLGSSPRNDGKEWLKGIITDKEDEKNGNTMP